MATIKTFVFNDLQENTYLLYDETRECMLIDPGCYHRHEEEELANFIRDNKLNLKVLINTHCHVDHVLGNNFVKEKYKVGLIIHPVEEETLRSVKVYAPLYGFAHYADSHADQFVEDGDVIRFGKTELKVLFVPGHSPGHIALLNETEKFCIAGDVLFRNGIGRTDLPGGDYGILIKSIREKILTLSDDVAIYPGHGPFTQVGYEKRTNPFLLNIC